MKKNTILKRFLCLALLCVFVTGCGSKDAASKDPIDCPFTDLGWETSPTELEKAKGECLGSYDSTYGGTTYTYETDYLDRTGTIKYMYDENDELMSVAWAYSSDDADELKKVYDDILEDTERLFGEGDYTPDEDTNYGKAWHMDNGNITLSVMLTDSNKALQVGYINPRNEEKKAEK